MPETSDRAAQEDRWRFEPMGIDPLFCWLAKRPARPLRRPRLGLRPFTARRVAWTSAVAIFVAWIVTALLGGDLTSAAAGPNAGRTLISIVTSVPGLFRSGSAAEYPSYPLFEDVAAWFFALASVVTFGLLYRQWNVMREIVPRLLHWRALVVDEKEEERFSALLGRVNRVMASMWPTVVLAIVALGLALVIFHGIARSGLYASLAPKGRSSWAQEAYAGWWAAAKSGSWPGAGAFVLLLATYLYFLLAQHFAGIMWVILTWRARRLVRFQFDLANMDGWFGWKPLRDLMITVYLSILVQVLALLPLLHLLPLQTLIYLVVPFGLFIVCNPVYVLTPWLTVSPVLHRERKKLLERTADDNAARPVHPRLLEHVRAQASAADEHAYLRSMRTFPFRLRELAIGVVTYGIPVVALILNK